MTSQDSRHESTDRLVRVEQRRGQPAPPPHHGRRAGHHSVIPREVFPEIDVDVITVTVAYPGAAPKRRRRGDLRPHRGAAPRRRRHRSNSLDRKRGRRTGHRRAASRRRRAPHSRRRSRRASTPSTPSRRRRRNRSSSSSSAARASSSLRSPATPTSATLKQLGQRVRDDIAALPGITHVDLTLARAVRDCDRDVGGQLQRTV